MQFQTNQIGHRKHLREQRADIVEMRENAVGAFVSFTAENFVTVNAEPVEEIFLSARRFLDEPPYHSLSRIEFSRMHFELRTKTDEVRFHISKVASPVNMSILALLGSASWSDAQSESGVEYRLVGRQLSCAFSARRVIP